MPQRYADLHGKRHLLRSLHINPIQLTAGILFLLAGALEYLFGRPPGSAYFLNPVHTTVLNLNNKLNPYGNLGFLAPDFFHPLAFALLCMALLPATLKNRIAICLAWLGIDAALELAQKYGPYLAGYLPRWVETIPLLKNLNPYLTGGTFDILDILAIGCGAATALLIGQLTKREKHDAVNS